MMSQAAEKKQNPNLPKDFATAEDVLKRDTHSCDEQQVILNRDCIRESFHSISQYRCGKRVPHFVVSLQKIPSAGRDKSLKHVASLGNTSFKVCA